MAKHHEKMCRARGGKSGEPAGGETEKDINASGKEHGKKYAYTGGDPEKEAEEEKESFQKGGKVKKKAKKDGHHADGHKGHERLDKRARGGRMGGSHSPLSMASSVKGRPGGDYDGEGKLDMEDD